MPLVFHLEFRVLGLLWEEKSRLVSARGFIYCNFMCKKVGWCWNDWNDADDVDDTTAGLKFDFFMCSKSLD